MMMIRKRYKILTLNVRKYTISSMLVAVVRVILGLASSPFLVFI